MDLTVLEFALAIDSSRIDCIDGSRIGFTAVWSSRILVCLHAKSRNSSFGSTREPDRCEIIEVCQQFLISTMIEILHALSSQKQQQQPLTAGVASLCTPCPYRCLFSYARSYGHLEGYT